MPHHPSLLLLTSFLTLGSPFNLDLSSPYIVSSDSDNYFGFSVALHQNSDGNYLLVSAPVSDTPQYGVVQGGAVYKCRVPDQLGDPKVQVTCTDQVTSLDAHGNKYVSRYDIEGNREGMYSYNETQLFNLQKEEKSHQWLGVTIQSTPDSAYLVGCAHKYETRYLVIPSFRDDPPRQLTGKCTLLDGEFNEIDLTYEPCEGVESGYTAVGNCQAGTSAFLYESSFLLGAPGCYEGSGGLFMYDIDDPLRTMLANERISDEGQNYSPYMGYSTTMCDFNADGLTDLFTGGPRGKGYLGIVLIYQTTPTLERVSPDVLPFDFELTGEQMGSYYGHSILCQDLNGDGIDDLVVGAPWYSIYDSQLQGRPDVGRIYFYPGAVSSDGYMFLPYDYDLTAIQKITGSEVSEAFGYSLSGAGDLNNDGVNDLLVGAPYYNEGEGRVYLYLGSPEGIESYPAQIITPTRLGNLPSVIRGFGWSIAGGKDMDGNGIPDVLVGSYLSHHAVLLRSVPVIDVRATVEIVGGDSQIDPDSNPNLDVPGVGKVPGIELQACFQYTGSYGESESESELRMINFKIKLDNGQGYDKSRLYTNYAVPSQIHFGQVEVNLKTKERICTPPFPAYFKQDITYSSTPIYFSMNADLDEKESFDDRAVLNQRAIAAADFAIYIASDCPDDTGVCSTEMTLDIGSVQYENQDKIPLVIGLVKELQVPITVTNKGPHTAYGTKLAMSAIPGVLPFIGPRSDCISGYNPDMGEDELYDVECTLPAILKDGISVSFYLEFDLSRMTAPRQFDISFLLTVVDPSVVISADEGVAVFSLDVQNLAQVQLRRGSSDDRLLYNNEYGVGNKALGYVGPTVKHAYELTLSDESMNLYVKEIALSVYWPLTFPDGSWLFPLSRVDMKLKNRAGDTMDSSDEVVSCEFNLVTNWDLIAKTFNPPSQLWEDIDCKRNTSLCHEVRCVIRELQRGGARVKLSFFSRVEEYFLYGFEELTVRSFAEVLSVGEGMILPLDQVSASISTTLVPSVSKSTNMTWKIIVAVLGALLILAIILIILRQCGFFTRVRPEPEPPMTVGYRTEEEEEEILLPQPT